ncbi:MAG TPA: methionyl-tRNA formyltransferase, partial [Deinococcales bacterium]|nr:methionyl-tRNA formyltransferase [Deinococcales bacterium]
ACSASSTGSLLAVPPRGFLNVHTSLLPLYRGAAPIQWALINGERETGVTIMQTDVGLDTGPVLLAESLAIGPDETAPELAARLSALGAAMIVAALDNLDDLTPRPQDDAAATLAPLLSREDGRLRWSDGAASAYDRYRGTFGWPGTWFEHGGKRVKVLEMRPAAGSGEPGSVLDVGERVTVALGEGALHLAAVQPEGRGRQPAGQWARAQGIARGTLLA